MIDDRALGAAFAFGQAFVISVKTREAFSIQLVKLCCFIELFEVKPDNQFCSSPVVGIEFLGELALPAVVPVNERLGALKHPAIIKMKFMISGLFHFL